LSLTWGSIAAGGYTVIGNLVVINVRVTTNTALSANSSYSIDGFPAPVTSGANNVPASSNVVSSTRDAYVSTVGSLTFTPSVAINSSAGIMFHAIYVKQ